ncbi:MAG TPA: lipocalin [Flavobacteriaceae bacterium]|nr:lipocalin [Flavobacteriaceae bacterium]
MKKTVLLLFAITLLSACGATQIERQAQRTLKGDWMLNRISYPDSQGIFEVNLFNDASASCFTGSSWNFVPNNNHGIYTINDASCATGERNFIFDVIETTPDSGIFDFTLKPVGEDENPRQVNTGYRLNLVSLSDTNMVWEQNVSLEGEPFTIRMHFIKSY